MGMPQDHETRITIWWIVDDLTESQVSGDKNLAFMPAHLGNSVIRRPLQSLVRRSRDLVAGPHKDGCEIRTDVLVQFESDRQRATSTGTTRSRVSSAA